MLRTYYYDALPYAGPDATLEQLGMVESKRRFFHALRQIPKLTVREGRVVRAWNADYTDFVYRQKFVDVFLAADLVRLAAKGKIDVAVLVSGDSDFIPAVEAAKEEGVSVRLLRAAGSRDVHHDLAAVVDEQIVLDRAMFDAIRIGRARPANDNAEFHGGAKPTPQTRSV